MEPFPLEYAPPGNKRSKLTVLTVILGIACGPLAAGIAILLGYMGADMGRIALGSAIPFVLTIAIGVAALRTNADRKQRQIATRGLVIAGIWITFILGLTAYAVWALYNNPM